MIPNHRTTAVILLLTIIFVLVSSCGQRDQKPISPGESPPENIDGRLDFLNPDGEILITITIEIANTFETQRKGLMDRRTLSLMHGMLFIFDKVEPKSFWMRNTHIPLDIIFIDDQNTVIKIDENTEPFSENSHRSILPVKYVVEVNAGFNKRFGIGKGIRIQWQPASSKSKIP